MRVGFVTGVFDILHEGHIAFLNRCKNLCDRLIVGLTTDYLCTVEKRVPFQSYQHRKLVLEQLTCVDVVIPNTGSSKLEAYERLGFNVLFTSEQYKNSEEFKEFELVKPCPVIYLPRYPHMSTTAMSTRILSSMLTNAFTILSPGIHGLPTYRIGDSVVKLLACGIKDSNDNTDGYTLASFEYPLLYPRNWNGFDIQDIHPNISGVNPFREMYMLTYAQKFSFVPKTSIATLQIHPTSDRVIMSSPKPVDAVITDRKCPSKVFGVIQPFCGRVIGTMGKMSSEKIDYIKTQLRNICDELKRERVIHGDIHGNNICMSEDNNTIYLIDWGWSLMSRFPLNQAEKAFFDLGLQFDFDYSHFVLSNQDFFDNEDITKARINVNSIRNGIRHYSLNV